MRKLLSLFCVVVMSFGFLAACSDSADALAERCKKDGGSEAQCTCMKDRVHDEMSTDEADDAVKALNADDQENANAQKMQTIYAECAAGADGTGGDGTNSGS